MSVASPRTAVRLLAAAMVILAAGCVALALAWREEHAEATCWREAFEDGEAPPEGIC